MINHLWSEIEIQRKKVRELEDKGKLPEPVITAIDLALSGDVTILTQVLDKTSKEIATAFGVSEEQLSDNTQRKPATDNPGTSVIRVADGVYQLSKLFEKNKKKL